MPRRLTDAASGGVGVVVGGDQPHDGAVVVEVGRLGADRDDRQDAGAVLAGRLGDELLGPGAEADVLGAVVDEHELVAQRLGARHRRAEAQRRVGVVVGGEQVGHRLGVVEQGLDVGTGEAARHQAEGREGGVAAADVGVGVDDPEAGRAGVAVERAARVGDDDDPGGGVDAGVGERLHERPPLAVGLDGGAGLARHDDDRALEVGQGAAHDVGVGGVEHDDGHAGRGADDLRGQRRAAHAAQHDAVEPGRGELVAQRRHLADEVARGAGEPGPGQPLGRLGLGRLTPQRVVLREEPARDPVGDQGRHVRRDGIRRRTRGGDVEGAHAVAFSSSLVTPPSSSPQDFSNLSTPSRSSLAVTSA